MNQNFDELLIWQIVIWGILIVPLALGYNVKIFGIVEKSQFATLETHK